MEPDRMRELLGHQTLLCIREGRRRGDSRDGATQFCRRKHENISRSNGQAECRGCHLNFKVNHSSPASAESREVSYATRAGH